MIKEKDLPRADGAWIYNSQPSYWYSWLNGQCHNSLGPAVIYDGGEKRWYTNGKLHCEDGPAIEYCDGSKQWWIDGDLHRMDGPVVERSDGSKAWYVNGKLHRLDGPAIERVNGHHEWWVDGKFVSEQDFSFTVISFLLGVDKKTAKIIERKFNSEV